MEEFKYNLTHKFLLVIFLVALLPSCSKDYDTDLLGTWIAYETIPLNGYQTQVKDIITFTKSRFTDLTQIYISSRGQYYDYRKLIGSVSVSGNTLYLMLSEIGFMSSSTTNGNIPGPLVFSRKGDLSFYYKITQGGFKESFTSFYSISGDKLTLMTDNNSDGDYSDPLETTVYTKQ